ncbi:MAG: kelch repeat-containing protein [Myxococcota bacterium]
MLALGCAQPSPKRPLEESFPAVAPRILEGRGFVPVAEGFRARELVLPREASRPVRFELGARVVELRELALAGEARREGAAISYEHARGRSWWATTASGFEEWVEVEDAGDGPVAQWELSGFALRELEDGVVLEDAEGLGVGRVTAPVAWARDGRQGRAWLRVEGQRLALYTDLRGHVLVDPLWAFTGYAPVAVSKPTVTMLFDGSLLVVGGQLQAAAASSAAVSRYDPTTGTWAAMTPLTSARQTHTATLLKNGKVLVTGGYDDTGTTLDTAELFDPATNGWTVLTSRLSVPRNNHTATLLTDGRVLIVGGSNTGPALATAERFDPTTNQFSAAGSLTTPRYGHRAVRLRDGRVLAISGYAPQLGTPLLTSAERYDPSTNQWTAAGTLTGRQDFSATLLPTGEVLVAGGTPTSTSCERYDPASNAWTATGNLLGGRSGHAATLLPTGKVLVAGGFLNPTYLQTTELYDPASGAWASGGSMVRPHAFTAAGLLPSGRVLVVGGITDGGATPTTTISELYDGAHDGGTITAANVLGAARVDAASVVLPSGQVLVVGGTNASGTVLNTAELFTPSSGTWAATGSMQTARRRFAATLLSNGLVLVAGGNDGTAALASAELFDPATGTWSPTAPMSVPRQEHTLTTRFDGSALAVGGLSGTTMQQSAEAFSPRTRTWSGGPMMSAHRGHTATQLADGRVVVIGGFAGSGNTPTATVTSCASCVPGGAWTWVVHSSLTAARAQHAATLLPNGKVLIAGGATTASLTPTAAGLVFDPMTNLTTATTPATGGLGSLMPAVRAQASTTLLPNGKVLVAGGRDGSGPQAGTMLFDPSLGVWHPGPNLTTARTVPAVALLPSGRALVAGGGAAAGASAVSELYDEGRNVAASMLPTVTAAPTSVAPDAGLSLTGTLFEGVSEGGRGGVDGFSASYPLVNLRGVEMERSFTLAPSAWSATSLSISNMPGEVPTGLYWLSVTINGARSDERLLQYFLPLSLTPATASRPPRGTATFTAGGGTGAWSWDFVTNASSGTLVNGAYTAGATGGVTDVIRITDDQGRTATASITVTAGVAVSPATDTRAPRSSRTFTASGGNGAPFTWSLSANNSGGTINATTGAYTAGSTGGVTDVVRATDSLGNQAEATITVTAGVSVSPASASVVPRGARTFSASGGSGTGFTWSFATNNSGGTLNATTGAYTAGATPSVQDTVRVTDSLGNTATATVSVGAGVSLTPASASVPPLGSRTFTASGGSGTGYTWSLSTNASGGAVTQSGGYTAGATEGVDVVQVVDSLGNTATASVNVTGALGITPGAVPVAPRGSVTFTASGGSGTGYTWELLTNNSGGGITAAGVYTAGPTPQVQDTVRVTDSLGARALATITVGAGVGVTPAMVTLAPRATRVFLASGGSNMGLTFALTTNGSGGSVDASSGAYLAGATGNTTDVVTATDSLGNSGTALITVSAGVSVTPQSPSTAPNGTIDFMAAGGSGTGWVWTLLSAPSGGTVNRDTGAYRAGATGEVSDVLRVVDSLGNEAQVSIAVGGSLAITPANPTVAPRATQGFTASGGSGSGYTWALVINASQGSIDANGLYRAGPVGGVMDRVEVTDSLGNRGATNITVSDALALTPALSSVPPRGALTFTATGGREPRVFSLSTNGSGGSIDAQTGAYLAGASSAQDVVTVTDALGEARTAVVNVTVGVSISPATVTRPIRGTVAFSASGGSGTGFTWSFETNGSGATLDEATGEYTAGEKGEVDDVVRVTDSLGNSATAVVSVLAGSTAANRTPFTTRAPVSGWSCGCTSASGNGLWPLLGLVLLGWRRRPTTRAPGRAARRSVLPLVAVVTVLAGLPVEAAPAKKPRTKTTKKAPAPPPPAPEPAPVVEPMPEPAPVATPPPPRAPSKPSVVVLDVEVSVPNEKLDGAAFTELVVSSVAGTEQFTVISSREVATLIGLERQKQLLGCGEESCMAEVANAIGSNFVLTSSVGRVGETYLVTVKLVDARRSHVAARTTLQADQPNALLAAIWNATQQTLDAYGAALPKEDAERWASRRRPEPPASVVAAASSTPNYFGAAVLAVGGLQPLSEPGRRGSIGAEVDLTFRRGRFDLFAGVIIGPNLGARLGASWALVDTRLRVSAGLRGAAYPGLGLYGGGVGVTAEFALTRNFGLIAVGAGEIFPTPQAVPQPPVVTVLGSLGVTARF